MKSGDQGDLFRACGMCVYVQIYEYLDCFVLGWEQAKNVLAGDQGDVFRACSVCVCVCVCVCVDLWVFGLFCVGREQAKKVLAGDQGDVFRACGMCVCVCRSMSIWIALWWGKIRRRRCWRWQCTTTTNGFSTTFPLMPVVPPLALLASWTAACMMQDAITPTPSLQEVCKSARMVVSALEHQCFLLRCFILASHVMRLCL